MQKAPDGNKIRDLRYEHGLSQPQLAALARVDTSTVSRIEAGVRGATPSVLKRIADALDVKVAQITRETSEVA